jgi:phenylalanyl-tRNA synthetase alpha subunit
MSNTSSRPGTAGGETAAAGASSSCTEDKAERSRMEELENRLTELQERLAAQDKAAQEKARAESHEIDMEYEEIKARTMMKMIEDVVDKKQRLLFLTNHQALIRPNFQNMAALTCDCLCAPCAWMPLVRDALFCM